MRAYDSAMSASWAMLPEAIEQLLEIAARENDPTPEALEAYRAARADNGERLGIRGNVGILYAKGPMFKGANLMTAFSGATSYEMLRRDLQVALETPAIEAIMLHIDSPGGEVSGCDELAASIFQARGKKPITAFVSGQGTSAAYWLGAAADRIVVSESAMVGSIGVVLGITDRTKADERAGIARLEFVSSQSPGKRPDHSTDAGRARVQKLVDDLGDVFVSAVAKYRGVSKTTVVTEFGQGGVEIGANAVKRKMADEVGQFEATLRALSARGKNARGVRTAISAAPSLTTLSPRQATSAPLASLLVANTTVADADERKIVLEVRQRMKAFAAMDAEPAPALHAYLRDETEVPADQAVSILNAVTKDLHANGGAVTREQAFIAKKARAGTLGLEGHPEYRASDGGSRNSATSGGWADAVALVNAKF